MAQLERCLLANELAFIPRFGVANDRIGFHDDLLVVEGDLILLW
jgi:hypothetical protein